jgi:hypothetical protein
VFVLDSTTIGICLSVLVGLVLQDQGSNQTSCLNDVKTSIPTFLLFNPKVIDVNILDLIHYGAGTFYVLDNVYVDYRLLYRPYIKNVFFLTRAKDNMQFKRRYANPVDMEQGVRFDLPDSSRSRSSWKQTEC